MRLDVTIYGVLTFIGTWVLIDGLMGNLGSSTFSECLAGVTVAVILYMGHNE
jgi:hypothetical protein